MYESPDISPYRIPGRLSDVIAAIQVMASAKRPEGKVKNLAYVLDRKDDDSTVEKWTKVFQQHGEFFLTYRLKDDDDLKAALRLRYAFKTYDSETGQEYTPAEIRDLPEDERKFLTTKAISVKENTILLVFLFGFGVAPAVT